MLEAYYAWAPPQAWRDVPGEKLSAYRLERLKRIKPDRQRDLSLCAELLLIDALNDLSPVALPLDIYTERGGKPRLREGPCFSLSHSGELAFCALSDAELGADVQKLPEREPEPRLLERCLSESERQMYLKSGNRLALFTILWSLKESYAKMDGAGLVPLHPAQIAIELFQPGRAAVTGSGAKLWYCVRGDYVFSICSEKYEKPQRISELNYRIK